MKTPEAALLPVLLHNAAVPTFLPCASFRSIVVLAALASDRTRSGRHNPKANENFFEDFMISHYNACFVVISSKHKKRCCRNAGLCRRRKQIRLQTRGTWPE